MNVIVTAVRTLGVAAASVADPSPTTAAASESNKYNISSSIVRVIYLLLIAVYLLLNSDIADRSEYCLRL